MRPRSLTGRLIAAFAILAVAILVAVGGTAFVALRDLHRETTKGQLADTADSLLTQVREAVAGGELRAALVELRDRLGAQGTEIFLATADGSLRTLDGVVLAGSQVSVGLTRGQTVRGEATIDGRRYLYASTVVRPGRIGGTLPQSVVFARVDRAGAEALADIGAAVPLVGFVVLLVGAPVAWLLASSVSRPLRRLSAATADLPAGATSPLPLHSPTEVRELTVRFNAIAGELEENRRREAELFANLRHDLRTPLTVIGGFAAALADGTVTGDAAERAAQAIGEEAARLERMMAELGAIERLRDGADSLRPEALDAGELLLATRDRFASRATAAGIDLALANAEARGVPARGEVSAPGAASPLGFVADRLAVERILANLVENALSAAPSPGGHVWMEARALSDGETGQAAMALSVTDDGPGFPPGAAERVFERFYRADRARSGPGSGLGLAIVRDLARAHGGRAHAENIAPRGARVSVVLPAVPGPATTNP